MRIIYMQSKDNETSVLSLFGIKNCYVKFLETALDQRRMTKKLHHHAGFEFHSVTDGYQIYEIGTHTFTLTQGKFLLIQPNISHRIIASSPHARKYSLTFHFPCILSENYFYGNTTDRILDDIEYIIREAASKKEFSPVLIENTLLKIIISVLRLSGMQEKQLQNNSEDNAIMILARQYIFDNTDRYLQVADVSNYCGLSTKQLTRIFTKFKGSTPGEYIKQQRILRIEQLLAEKSLSLKQISDLLNFSSEYHFNSFVKKNIGVPPGEYRKTLGG